MREESSADPSSTPPDEAGESSSGPLCLEVEEAKPSNGITSTPGAASTMAERAHNNQEDQDQEQNTPTKMSRRRERRREQVYRENMTATAAAASTSTTVTDPADTCKYPTSDVQFSSL
jgi:hypothetical protein